MAQEKSKDKDVVFKTVAYYGKKDDPKRKRLVAIIDKNDVKISEFDGKKGKVKVADVEVRLNLRDANNKSLTITRFTKTVEKIERITEKLQHASLSKARQTKEGNDLKVLYLRFSKFFKPEFANGKTEDDLKGIAFGQVLKEDLPKFIEEFNGRKVEKKQDKVEKKVEKQEPPKAEGPVQDDEIDL